jgi:YidC/Oxa1 family membrane protein insertase
MNDPLIALLANLTQLLGGSLGCAIITLSLAIRLALLPLTIWLARRAQRNQEIMRALQPELDQLKKRFEKHPDRFFEEMRKLYQKHDCSPFDLPALLGGLVQLPIFAMFYSSIRSSLGVNSAFLWIKNLASPDFCLTLAILCLTGMSAYFMPSASAQARNMLIMVQVLVVFFMVWKLSAALSLYWLTSGAVSLCQTACIRPRNKGSE